MRLQHCLSTLVAILSMSSASVADVVTDWNDATLETIRQKPLNPLVATRTLAMVHTAIHDAANGVDPHYERYYVQGSAHPHSSAKAAAAQAAYDVLSTLYPDRVDYFSDVLGKSLSDVPRGPARFRGRLWGHRVGTAILALREDDNWDLVVPYIPSGELGRWQPTPPAYAPALLPNWPLVTPWTMTSGSQFRIAPAPALSSEAFAEAFNEVKELGRAGSPARSKDQTQIAYFWEDGSGSVLPPGHWQVYAQQVSQAQGYDLWENARLFALLSLAQADSLISAWDSKYHHDVVRPVSNIQLEADLDNNPDTQADPNWLPEITTPPFPSYASGHSTVSSASARILELFVESDAYHFCGGSPDPQRWPDILPGVVRCWGSFRAAAEEAGQSRIYAGIHWQFDNLPALDAGRDVASQTYADFLRPL
jgi:hypothetical protein